MIRNESRPRHKGGSVTNDIAILSDRAAEVRRIRTEARRAADERRRRVLAHSDLAQRLTQQPLNFSSPEKWNGYVPPATGFWGPVSDPRPGSGEPRYEVPNDSPCYYALCELGRAVAERERGEG